MTCSAPAYATPRKMRKSSVYFPVLAPWRLLF